VTPGHTTGGWSRRRRSLHPGIGLDGVEGVELWTEEGSLSLDDAGGDPGAGNEKGLTYDHADGPELEGI